MYNFRSDHRSKNAGTVAYATDNSRAIRCGSLVIPALQCCAAKKEETPRSLIAGFLLTQLLGRSPRCIGGAAGVRGAGFRPHSAINKKISHAAKYSSRPSSANLQCSTARMFGTAVPHS